MDLTFFLIVMTLLVIGIIMMFSASYAKALNESGGTNGTSYATKQITMAAIGIFCMFFFSFFDYRHFANPKIAITSYVGCVILLIAVLVNGVTEGGATRWIVIGPINFQPSELMKFSIIILFSYLIVKNYNKMQKFSVGILPFGIFAWYCCRTSYASAASVMYDFDMCYRSVPDVCRRSKMEAYFYSLSIGRRSIGFNSIYENSGRGRIYLFSDSFSVMA